MPIAPTMALRTAWPSASFKSDPSTAVAICAVVGAALIYAEQYQAPDTVAIAGLTLECLLRAAAAATYPCY